MNIQPKFLIAMGLLLELYSSLMRKFNEISTAKLPNNFAKLSIFFTLAFKAIFFFNYCDFLAILLNNSIYQTSLPVTGAMKKHGLDHQVISLQEITKKPVSISTNSVQWRPAYEHQKIKTN